MGQGRRLRYDYPNNEVRLTFASSPLEGFGRYIIADELTDLHRALATEDYVDFCTRLNIFMAGIPGEKITNETDCHLILHALCQLMRVEFQSEVRQSVEAALEQIEARDYGRRYFASGRRVVAVGLNFVGGSAEEPPRIEYQARVRGLSDPDSA